MEPNKAALILVLFLLSGFDAIDHKPKCDVSKLTKDMTRQQVMEVCGKPTEINANNYSEQWVYDHESYIYIRDGHFSSAQWVIR